MSVRNLYLFELGLCNARLSKDTSICSFFWSSSEVFEHCNIVRMHHFRVTFQKWSDGNNPHPKTRCPTSSEAVLKNDNVLGVMCILCFPCLLWNSRSTSVLFISPMSKISSIFVGVYSFSNFKMVNWSCSVISLNLVRNRESFDKSSLFWWICDTER